MVDVAVARENGLSIRPRGGPQSSDLISMDEAGHLQSRLKSDMASNMSLGIMLQRYICSNHQSLDFEGFNYVISHSIRNST